MTQAIAQISLDAQLIRDRLQETKVGETVTYEELSKLIGRDVRNRAMGALGTARKHAMKNKNMVFVAVSNEGLKRMSDIEIVDSVDGDIRRVRRTVRRSSAKITRVDFNGLPNDKKIDHNAKLSMLGALQQFAAPSSLKTLKSRVEESREVLPIGKTLEAFR